MESRCAGPTIVAPSRNHQILVEAHNKRVESRQFAAVRPAKTVGDIGNGRVSQTRHGTSASLFLMSARAGEANDRAGTVAVANMHFQGKRIAWLSRQKNP